MNEMEQLERQLRAWAPRRPSAKLRQKLFGRVVARAPRAFALHWLAPATAALLVACMLFNQRYCASFIAAGDSGSMVAMILSNQSAAASLPAGFEWQQNGLRPDFINSSGSGEAGGFAVKRGH